MTVMELLVKATRRHGTTPEQAIERSNGWRPEVTRDIDADFEKLRHL